MSTSAKDIELTFFQAFILRFIKYFPCLEHHPKKTIDFLDYYNLIHKNRIDTWFGISNKSVYHITEKGRLALQHRRKDKFRWFVTTTIAILALFGGYDVYKNPLLVSVLSSIKQLVVNILESLDAFF